MDRTRARAGVLSGLVLAALALAAAGRSDLPLTGARWLAPDARVEALTEAPAECFARPREADAALSAEIGRAAFRAPLLLGGQAARVGISCASCHRNGRGNPDFLFPGLSGAPGTADVTSSLMSSHRGDGTLNPRPIPDLAGPRSRLRIGRGAALAPFIRGLIVEEFDGAPPPPRVLGGLEAYVRALSPEACARRWTQRLTLDTHIEDVGRAVAAAVASWRLGDADTTRLMIGSARSALALVHERYAGSGLARERAAIEEAARSLGDVLESLDEGAEIGAALAAWPSRLVSLRRLLVRGEARSLFNRSRLRAALAPAMDDRLGHADAAADAARRGQ